MDKFLLALMAIAIATGLIFLAVKLREAAKRRVATRLGFLDDCRPLFKNPRTTIAPTGFPRLAGDYAGQRFDLQVLPDTLTFRKLPALWILVTLPEPMPVRATFDLMIRPTGVEPFSNFNRLSDQIAVPEGFPADCAIRSDDPANMVSDAFVRQHLHLFDDPSLKELIISPKGLRLVFLAEEAVRSNYLIFRDAEMGNHPLARKRVQPLLDALLKIRSELHESAHPKLESMST